MRGFVRTPIGLSLDALAQRYGCRPSLLMGMNPLSGESLVFDMAVASASAENDKLMRTTGGQVRARRAGWSSEAKRELKHRGNR